MYKFNFIILISVILFEFKWRHKYIKYLIKYNDYILINYILFKYNFKWTIFVSINKLNLYLFLVFEKSNDK